MTTKGRGGWLVRMWDTARDPPVIGRYRHATQARAERHAERWFDNLMVVHHVWGGRDVAENLTATIEWVGDD